jgi:PTH1 family peptidyl-tRNA hydrolase
MGIGRGPFVPVEEYVLSKFRKDELPLVREAVINAVNAIRSVITEGIEKAMNKFN